jgi:wyosine [tRNA(Phe)-imidazoG37] synthetase (radical SAM superfamily)
MPIPLQHSAVYGPVHSRRLGISLGINPLPVAAKVCNFNCVYCQYGSTHGGWDTISRNGGWPAVSALLDAIESVLKTLTSVPDHLTIAGNGEPTAHPEFPALVDGLLRLRDRYVPSARTAILSNASLLSDPAIRTTIQKLDLRVLKVDCGDQSLFLKYNRPTISVNYDDILRTMTGMEGVTVQTLITGGKNGNDDPAAVERWVHRMEDLSPSMIQLYSLDRDCEDKSLHPVSRERLLDIQRRLAESAIPSEIY